MKWYPVLIIEKATRKEWIEEYPAHSNSEALREAAKGYGMDEYRIEPARGERFQLKKRERSALNEQY